MTIFKILEKGLDKFLDKYAKTEYVISIGIIGPLAIWGLAAWILITKNKHFWNYSLAQFGQFGDSFGVINTLFMGFTCVGLVFTLFFQTREMDKRDRERHQDKFEDHFFQMINSLRSMVSLWETQVEGKTETVKGQTVFRMVLSDIQKRRQVESGDHEEMKTSILHAYEKAFIIWQNYIGPHLRVIFLILERIEKTKLSKSEKKYFSSMLKAELTGIEITIVAIEGLSNPLLKDLIEVHGMLAYIPDIERFPKSFFQKCYKEAAFYDDTKAFNYILS